MVMPFRIGITVPDPKPYNIAAYNNIRRDVEIAMITSEIINMTMPGIKTIHSIIHLTSLSL